MEIINFKQYSKTIRFVGRVAKEILTTTNKNTLAKNIKNDIVRMGPVYIKIGQIVSTRTDIFPSHITNVFKDLQNEVEYMSYEEVEGIFESQFNERIDVHFSSFDEIPLAAASIGQVHRGVLRDHNREVAIKVLRKDIESVFNNELSAIINIIRFTNKVNKNKNTTDLLSILQELYNNIKYETDFNEELNNMVKFREILDGNDKILVPRIYKRLSSKEILTMEYLPSIKITDVSTINNYELATNLMKSFVLMVLNDGYIHCDPHPGNIGINDGGKIVLYDFGMVKRFDVNIKEYFRRIVFALMNRSGTELMEFMLTSGILEAKESKGKTIDTLTGYETIVLERMLGYVYNYLNTLDIQILMKSILEDQYIDVDDIPFEFDTQLVYLFKSFSTLEGVCKQLYPDFNYIDFLSEVILEFFDMNMIMDKMVFDIKSTQLQSNQLQNQNYMKMSIEKLNKKLETQNKNLVIFLILSMLFDLLSL
jgi:predicted unusual protein kinase regulating ubiquinone biosynthesis (AarF/ABC1/UbiB family)